MPPMDESWWEEGHFFIPMHFFISEEVDLSFAVLREYILLLLGAQSNHPGFIYWHSKVTNIKRLAQA